MSLVTLNSYFKMSVCNIDTDDNLQLFMWWKFLDTDLKIYEMVVFQYSFK